MNLEVSFKNLDSSDALREKAKEKLESLDSLLSPSAQVHLTFWAHDRKKVGDIRIHDYKHELFAKAYSDDFYKTIDMLRNKMRTQIVKTREKLKAV